MDTNALKSFAVAARAQLLQEVGSRLDAVLPLTSAERRESGSAMTSLDAAVASEGRDSVVDRVAYTWFNRIVALRYMDANGFTGAGIVSPPQGERAGQPEVLADAKSGHVDGCVPSAKATRILDLLAGRVASADPQQEAYRMLLATHCNALNASMPFLFERIDDYTELLMPADLLSERAVPAKAVVALSADVCADVEVIGWLYQFYISERKDEVFEGFKKNKKAGAAEIPAATQLFTPHWIVRYLVENSLGRLWMLNHPNSRLDERMEYYIAPEEPETEFLRISTPMELKVLDPACGSGHMLTLAFDLLQAIYEEEGYSPADTASLIISNNLFGVEIDQRAGSLAAFALTMKARALDARFMTRDVAPNLCVLSSVSFTEAELHQLLTRGGNKYAETDFWQAFADADLFGSLIRPNEDLLQPVTRQLAAISHDGTLLVGDFVQRAHTVLTQVQFLSQRYHVVIANPPYMGSGNMDARLNQFLMEDFPDSKTDLYSAFIERLMELALPKGYVAMLTMQSWLFLSTYGRFRRWVLSTADLQTLCHLGTNAFDSIGGEVVAVVAFVLRPQRQSEAPCVFIRLTDASGESGKASAARGAVMGQDGNRRFEVVTTRFNAVPGSAFVYWATDRDFQNFATLRPLSVRAETREGMATGDNGKFLRRWFEVDFCTIGFGAQSLVNAEESGRRWFPYQKGGAARSWYGNNEYVVNWERDGRDVRANIDSVTGRVRSHNYNGEYAFREGFTWPAISSGPFHARWVPAGFMFDGKGPMGFARVSDDLYSIVALLNSRFAVYYMAMLAPTLDFKVGSILQVPVPALSNELSKNAVAAIGAARSQWNSTEASWDFSMPLLHGSESMRPGSLSRWTVAWDRLEVEWETEVRLAEQRIEQVLAEAYGVDLRELADRAWEVPSRKSDFRSEEIEKVRALLSLSVGCMLGRYALDMPGVVLGVQGDSLADFLAKVPNPSFLPDEDNVIPVLSGEWFADDIVGRFREFLRVSFGEQHFEENLRFIEEALGKDIRRYFVTDFYKDHVQRYKKRPIYWMFSSPKGSFNALIYMHRYQPDTVSVVLNKYLREFQAKLSARLTNLGNVEVSEAASAREKTAARKESDDIRRTLQELADYEHDVLFPLATKNLTIDLDDGVKANYPKFGAALKKIPGLDADD